MIINLALLNFSKWRNKCCKQIKSKNNNNNRKNTGEDIYSTLKESTVFPVHKQLLKKRQHLNRKWTYRNRPSQKWKSE